MVAGLPKASVLQHEHEVGVCPSMSLNFGKLKEENHEKECNDSWVIVTLYHFFI